MHRDAYFVAVRSSNYLFELIGLVILKKINNCAVFGEVKSHDKNLVSLWDGAWNTIGAGIKVASEKYLPDNN